MMREERIKDEIEKIEEEIAATEKLLDPSLAEASINSISKFNSKKEDLRKLNQLLYDEIITQEEFDAKKEDLRELNQLLDDRSITQEKFDADKKQLLEL